MVIMTQDEMLGEIERCLASATKLQRSAAERSNGALTHNFGFWTGYIEALEYLRGTLTDDV